MNIREKNSDNSKSNLQENIQSVFHHIACKWWLLLDLQVMIKAISAHLKEKPRYDETETWTHGNNQNDIWNNR